MQNVTALIKEKMLLRSSNPVRSSIIGLIISEAKQNAKDAKREVVDSDIEIAAKGLQKRLVKALPDMASRPDMLERTNKEISELETFLPKALGSEETSLLIEGIILTLPQADRQNRKAIMSKLKDIPQVDMSLASKIINEIFTKEKV